MSPAARGLRVFERGWLSSNNILFGPGEHSPWTVVDTGYATHADQTVSLIDSALGGDQLGRIINTHLHSDHCGGNSALQDRWPGVRTSVPFACLDAVQAWDESALSYRGTSQRCDRFAADEGVEAGEVLGLGGLEWDVHAAPGHDPTALMLFEPRSRTLISADALWERKLAIVFPELVGEPGFDDCMATLDAIERLSPRVVIPGHGSPFSDVKAALRASRDRIAAFRANPLKHRRHALRSLVMFHMLELQRETRVRLLDWLEMTPIAGGLDASSAAELLDGLVRDGVLVEHEGELVLGRA